ncbi:MAG: glycoside hydrolase family 2 [Chitinophagaceae bacterium]|nr:glycoside hydrolase family 2 [Chitinophagaceae bacterium]
MLKKMKQIIILFFLFSLSKAKATDSSIVTTRFSPLPVQVFGLKEFLLDLNGNWSFNPEPAPGFEKSANADASWKKIEVPGEWAMQGFKVEKNRWAGYIREVNIPADWKGRLLKLRFHAVYSHCEVYVNGKKAGEHLGGFTAFELDITTLASPGKKAIIALRVKNESVANGTSNASRYAVHPLGGISRKVQLIALPAVNIAQFHATTTFDRQYKNAVLKTEVTLSNESKTVCNNATLHFELQNKKGVKLFAKKIAWSKAIAPGNTDKEVIEFAVDAPEKWDPEHPDLYTLKLTVLANDQSEEVVRRIGFRQIEVRGSQVFVNNMPVKLRGACHHEVMPLRGRSVYGNTWAEDVRLFREANHNYLRTSHYPPAEELVAACDSMGMFLEIEAPFCWAHETIVDSQDSVSILQRQTLDMVSFFQSAPSVLMWSIGNESNKYKEYFSATAAMVKKLDPSRPRIFSQWGPDADNGELEITNHHYPGPTGPSKYSGIKRPIVFDEYVHINAYNRFELVTDPGIRDAWGIGFNAMWENMYKTPSILGGAIWAGIDDSFFMPDSTVVGYGTWGIIDGWRRPKPEYWNTKKIYSPVKIKQMGNWNSDTIGLEIENRHLFSNLNECAMLWRAGKLNGTLKAEAAAGTIWRGALKTNGTVNAGDTLFVDVYDPRRVLIDQYAFTLLPQIQEAEIKKQKTEGSIVYKTSDNIITASMQNMEVKLDKASGALSIHNKKNVTLMNGMANLMVLPLNGEGRGIQMTGTSQKFEPYTQTAANRVVKSIWFETTPGAFVIKVEEEYEEAGGYIMYTFTGDGNIKAAYRYVLNKNVNPRQWGLVFTLTNEFNTLQWKRKGLWNYYPEDEVGRLSGTATAMSTSPVSGAAGPGQKPNNTWAQDRNELGTNDFRSTKMYITEAQLSDGKNKIKILSDGTQHIRAWKEKGYTKMLVAGYSNLGAEGFFRDHAALLDKPLKSGDVIEGIAELQIVF